MAREAGAAILLISEDLEEVLTLSDRVSVMYNGTLSEPILNQSIDKIELGLLMTGEGFNAA